MQYSVLFCSAEHVPPAVVFGVGHGANSQFGPILPTLDPSGHSFASAVQAFGLEVQDTSKMRAAMAEMTIENFE